MAFATSQQFTNAVPNGISDEDWSTCYNSSTALGDSYIVRCVNNLNPLARVFSITATQIWAMELREVEVYGYRKLVLLSKI